MNDTESSNLPSLIEQAAQSEAFTTTRIRLDFPPVDRFSLLKGETWRQLYTKEHQFKLDEQRINFEKAHEVVILAQGGGIGDAIMQLRPTFAMARTTAEAETKKQFTIILPESVANIRYLDLPENVQVVTEISPAYITRTNTFFMDFSSYGDICSKLKSLLGDNISPQQVTQLDKSNRVSDISSVSGGWILTPVQKLARQLDKGNRIGLEYPYNISDLSYILHLHLLGINPSLEDYSRLIFRIEANNSEQPKGYNFLIAPDAKEVTMPIENRSTKSLSTKKWREIFTRFPRNKKIAIIAGQTHEPYTRDVYDIANDLGLDVEYVKTPTLDNFIAEVLKAGTFVGMDSGTTHIASEAAMGANTQIKEIFHDVKFDLYDLLEYGVKGVHSEILSHGKSSTLNDEDELDNIPADSVVSFMLTNENNS